MRRRPKNQRVADLDAREQLADDGCSCFYQTLYDEEQDEIDWDEQDHYARLWYPDGRLLRSIAAYAEGPFATIGDVAKSTAR